MFCPAQPLSAGKKAILVNTLMLISLNAIFQDFNDKI